MRRFLFQACLGLCLVLLASPGAAAAQASVSSLIVYGARDTDGRQQLFAIAPDGSGKRRLTDQGQANFFPACSPDGQEIAFTSHSGGTPQLWMVQTDGSNPTQLTTDGSNVVPSWSPDGQQIAFGSDRTGHFEIWVMDADGGNQKQLTHTAADVSNNAAAWSPGGRQIAFTSTRSGHYAVWVMNADGTDPRQLTTHHGSDYADANVPAWSPDGHQIAFWSGIEHQYGEIWVMDADGSNRKQLTDQPPRVNSDEPVWSPDGKHVLFASNRFGSDGIGIWIMGADGSNPRILVPDTHVRSRPTWCTKP